MMNSRAGSLAIVAVMGITSALGCGCFDKKDQQIKALSRDKQLLLQQKDELTRELEACQSKPADTGQIDMLRQQLASAENQVLSLQGELAVAKAANAAQPAQAQPPQYNNNQGNGGRVEAGGDVIYTVGSDIAFSAGSATLTSAGKRALSEAVRDLNGRYRGYLVKVYGHTDSDPIRKTKDKWRDNYDLSEARARAVKSYLMSQGVPARDIETIGMGADSPLVSPERTRADKARNRRVEIKVVIPRR